MTRQRDDAMARKLAEEGSRVSRRPQPKSGEILLLALYWGRCAGRVQRLDCQPTAAISDQAMIQLVPPSGVIAPSQVCPLSTSA